MESFLHLYIKLSRNEFLLDEQNDRMTQNIIQIILKRHDFRLKIESNKKVKKYQKEEEMNFLLRKFFSFLDYNQI